MIYFTLLSFCLKQCIYKRICIKFLQILDMLTDTYIFNRNVHFRLNSYGNATFSCSVKFCEDYSRNISNLTELFCLCECILTCRSVKYDKCFSVCVRIFSLNYPVYLF